MTGKKIFFAVTEKENFLAVTGKREFFRNGGKGEFSRSDDGESTLSVSFERNLLKGNMLELITEKYELLIFVYLRSLGFVAFSPIFGRRNIPAMVKSAIALVFALVMIMPMEAESFPQIDNIFIYMIVAAKELVYGFAVGMTVNIFYSVVSISGEIMDMQMGLGMSKVYDPGSNIQMPMMGSFLSVAFILVFFLTNSHVTLIQILFVSYDILPVGHFYLSASAGLYFLQLFGYILTLSVKLAFPVIAAELITETGIGIIMRAVPQINVFVVGVQLKVLVCILVMIIAAPVSVLFFDGLMYEMNSHIEQTLLNLAGV